ncbi:MULTISPECIES: sensor histidine kinase [Rhodococcus]|uniref:Two-component system sensor kinase n=1 Tax=Rhodococcus qingshengii JCM 15477 TaxID=1303681 RepID=A0AB38RPV5_RHOSG|nr:MULTISPECIES: hypothetical protein [Rhodococcus]MCC4306133.1 hypothetical protein [Rhodococcus sp. 3-2]UPU46936.1 hypothetical protein M0639_34490 [Rhodococcus qingshengii JCM 15477]
MGSGSWESSAARSRFQAAWFGVLLRHSVNVLCGVVYLSFPPRTTVGVAVAVVLIGWGSFRLLTRSMTSSTAVWADYVLIVVVAVTIPSTTEGIDVVSSNSLPLAVSGSAVLSFAFSQRHWQAVLAAVGIALAFAVGLSGVVGVESPWTVFWPYFFLVQCGIGIFLRQLVERGARAADAAGMQLAETERDVAVAQARREYQREHWATVHDTAAATMLMIGHGVPLTQERVRRQAARDLQALRSAPALESGEQIDLRRILDDIAVELGLSVSVTGAELVRVSGTLAHAVAGAVREALTNVERHSGTRAASLVLRESGVDIVDAGTGFSAADAADTEGSASTMGHGRGIAESITGRMTRVGGSARVESAPGAGTRIVLDWDTESATAATESVAGDAARVWELSDPARRAFRLSRGYGLGLVGVAVILTTLIPVRLYGPELVTEPTQMVLIGVLFVVIVLGACTVTGMAVPRWVKAAGFAAVSVVTFVQPFTTDDAFGTGEHWAFGMTGWVLLPLLLTSPVRMIMAALVFLRVVTAAAAVIGGEMNAGTFELFGYSLASELAVQMIAGFFATDLRRTARLAAEESEAQSSLIAGQEIADRVQADYRSRYTALEETTVPLLRALAEGSITADSDGVRARAAVESARMRRLFLHADGQLQLHPLAREIQDLTALGERNGVSVVVEIPPDLSSVDGQVRSSLLAVPALAVAAAREHARIVVTETPELQVSVVADCDPTRVDDLEAVETTGIQVRVEYDEGLIWVQATAAPTSAYPPESKQPTASGHAPSLSDAAR